MPERNGFEPGTPCWVDLVSPDIDASAAFYGELFGWTADPSPSEIAEQTAGYRNATLDGRLVAGIAPLMTEGQPPVWSTYVATADADATTASVRENGGTVIVEPMDIMELGRMAMYADPTGAAFGVWQAGEHRGAGVVNEHGAICWNEVHTRDADAARSFYRAVFGWSADEMDMEGTAYTMFKAGESPVGGLMSLDQMPADTPPHWLTTFAVDDADAAVETATRLGGTVTVGPMDSPIGRYALLADPHGAAFGVIALAQPTE